MRHGTMLFHASISCLLVQHLFVCLHMALRLCASSVAADTRGVLLRKAAEQFALPLPSRLITSVPLRVTASNTYCHGAAVWCMHWGCARQPDNDNPLGVDSDIGQEPHLSSACACHAFVAACFCRLPTHSDRFGGACCRWPCEYGGFGAERGRQSDLCMSPTLPHCIHTCMCLTLLRPALPAGDAGCQGPGKGGGG
jgi:hypothetical protein